MIVLDQSLDSGRLMDLGVNPIGNGTIWGRIEQLEREGWKLSRKPKDNRGLTESWLLFNVYTGMGCHNDPRPVFQIHLFQGSRGRGWARWNNPNRILLLVRWRHHACTDHLSRLQRSVDHGASNIQITRSDTTLREVTRVPWTEELSRPVHTILARLSEMSIAIGP